MTELFEYGYAGLFIASFVAATIIPLSSEALLGLMIYNGYNIPLSITVATIGNSLGGMTSYYLGYLGKWEWLEKYFRIKKEKIAAFQKKIYKRGGIAAFFTWLPFVGDLIAVSLGVLRCNVWMVAVFMFAGKLARYLVWAYLTYLIK